ncbi:MULTISPECIES: dTDP-4-dehydrorhamnose 3,5-epimerase [Persicobacter]|uniref:dTDP-4-dehydrorhamnose 3,5-epimerase n=1 Tax=Persicobacter diffluens TaxID=981 RepID=A0AAN5AMR0_9BACT|nr:dTDP-4-dehydrorhamnose 3,5-epimerase [Persicobacter sp. CCB-QB2]GJM62113.1 dTDP-4-dehydrorhamnose 3,5-epimerase [Persicobacter diffluens]
MKVIETSIAGLVEIQPDVFGDARGYFLESYSEEKYMNAGIKEKFVQDNQSFSTKGVLRGLHFQRDPHAQGKLVRVVMGKVLDIAVDLRPDSSTFGQWDSCILDAQKHNQFYVPPGFAHGFLALEDSIFSYKCTNGYNKEAEGGIIYNDPELNIDWGSDLIQQPNISDKDKILPTFAAYKAAEGL